MLTYDRLVEVLEFNASAGQISNCATGHVYKFCSTSKLRIKIDGVNYCANRLFWFFYHKEYPQTSVYCIDGNPNNLTASNLTLNKRDTVVELNNLNADYTKSPVTQEILHDLFDYNYFTGSLSWRHRPVKYFKSSSSYKAWNKRFEGKGADSLAARNGCNYKVVTIFGKTYYAHRIAWIYNHGGVLTREVVIDHKNHNGLDNRMCNLRLGTVADNIQHQIKPLVSNTTSGLLGVHWSKRNQCWYSQIRVNSERINIGGFHDKYDAYNAYLEAKRKYHRLNTL